MSLRDKILAKREVRTREVIAFGEKITVRAIDSGERMDWESDAWDRVRNRMKRTGKAKLVILAACDADMRPIFTPADEAQLAAMDAGEVERIYDAAAELCGMRLTVDDAEKNSETSRSGNSPCVSLCNAGTVTSTLSSAN